MIKYISSVQVGIIEGEIDYVTAVHVIFTAEKVLLSWVMINSKGTSGTLAPGGEAMETNDVVLYVNSDRFKFNQGSDLTTATHYIHVVSIKQIGSKYEITYWDYGDIQRPITMDAAQFSSAVYGMIKIPKTND